MCPHEERAPRLMPRRPPAPCTSPGCPALVSGGGRCDRHKPKDQRPSSSARGYDRRWEAFAKAYLAKHPNCVEPGCTRPATDVDHLDGLGPLGPRGYDETNVAGRCHPHHSQKTALKDGGFGRARRG